jgi:hypothetical protein
VRFEPRSVKELCRQTDSPEMESYKVWKEIVWEWFVWSPKTKILQICVVGSMEFVRNLPKIMF